MHAMKLFGQDPRPLQKALLEHQLPDGRWPGDKWHTAWTYATLLALYVLKDGGREVQPHLERAVEAIEQAQKRDGSWGPDGGATTIDTAYAALALAVVSERVSVRPHTLQRAREWLLDHYRPFDYHCEPTWLNKQQYTPYRIDWAFILSAMLVLDGMILHDKSFNPVPETVPVFA
jgi:squalene cyclase